MRLELKFYALGVERSHAAIRFRNGEVQIMDASAVVSLGFGVDSFLGVS